ncbi:hypothetical protein D5272_07720 [bacterium D16-76]|nr:hypothetical protein [bacterium D16-76]
MESRINTVFCGFFCAARERAAVLFSTHILSDEGRICNEAAFLHDGEIAMRNYGRAEKQVAL